MPILNIPTGATPALLTALTPVAANPIAPIGEGGDGGFAAVIAGIPGAGLMLDAPPAMPDPGTVLPPGRPEIAGQPQPLPVIDVEQVMVGSALPKPIMAPMPAELPAAVPPSSPPAVPSATGGPEVIEAPAPGPKPWSPRAESPIIRAHVAPDRTAPECRHLPAPGQPVAVEPASPTEATAVKPIEMEAAESPNPVLLELAPPAVLAMPTPVSPEAPRPVVVEAPDGAIPEPIIVLPMPARTLSAPVTLPVELNKATVDRPLEPAPADADGAPTQPMPAPPLRPDFVLPPELARQVAQIIRPVVTTDEPVVDVPAFDFAPLSPVAASQPAPITVQAAPPVQLGTVDTARAEWMQAMIDRIGDIAQEDGKREAQIRLRPDALGAIEVKIVERDNRYQVTLNADTAQTRQLLSEHAPRLAELAEARGLRFAQTDIGGGAQQQERRPAPEPQSPLRPRSARAESHASMPETGDRIA